MITLKLDNAEELAKALYYAQLAAAMVRWDSPHSAPPDVQWHDLEPALHQLWRATAARLLAQYKKKNHG
jgi:hypothetical protein